MKKHHWHVFLHEKLFEKQPLPHCQTDSKSMPCDFFSSFQFYFVLVHYEETCRRRERVSIKMGIQFWLGSDCIS
jgi:hypothetical protein